jgi:eukaryotic-like serine/threonine-protein kinase
LIIFIDDLQWGDLDSAALLSEILRPPDPPQLLLIASYRSDEADTNPILKTLLSARTSTNQAVQMREVSIDELSQANARKLVAELLGKGSLSPHWIDAIVRESGGNPFFIDELVRYAQMNADAFPENSDQLDTAGMKLDKVLQLRVAQLPEKALRLLTIIAVAGQPIERAVAKRAADLDTEEQAILVSLRAGHLIRVKGSLGHENIETYHDRIRETIVANLSAEGLRDYHRNLAAALEAAGVLDPERLVIHYQSAGDFQKAAIYAAAAAEQASEALAFDRAARLYQLAIEMQPEQNKNQWQIKLGAAQANAGRSALSALAYLAAAEDAAPAAMIDLQQRAAEQLLRGGHVDDGLAILSQVLGKIGMKLAKTPMHALLHLIIRRFIIQLRGLKFHERTSAQIPPDELIRIDTCWSAATGLAIVDTIRGSDFQTRHLLLALQAGEPYRIARALCWEIA